MKTKQRGLRRKCTAMVQRITEETEVFPQPHLGYDFWHWHLPIPPSQIYLVTSLFGVRKLCIQTLVDRAHHLATIASASATSTRVVVAVSWPDLWSSQLIVFFGNEYFNSFFTRNRPDQQWMPMEENRSLAREWTIQIPDGFSERGIHQEIHEADFSERDEIWFIGQLSASTEVNR